MPIRLAAPLFSVDAEKMQRVDTRNVENLFGMWSGMSHLRFLRTRRLANDSSHQSIQQMRRNHGGWY